MLITPTETSANHVLERLTNCPKVRITLPCVPTRLLFTSKEPYLRTDKMFPVLCCFSFCLLRVFFLLPPPPALAHWQLRAAAEDDKLEFFFLKVNWP